MSILVDKNSRVVVQGITGSAGSFHAKQMLEYGTNIVAGVTPGKGGTKFEGKVPIYNTVEEAVKKEKANVSAIFVPPLLCTDAIIEAASAGIKLAVVITEGIPIIDEVKLKYFLRNTGMEMIGPNCPGIITPGQTKIGIMPGYIHRPGDIGLISRSGTLTYEAVWQLSNVGLGQSTCVGIGGDPIVGHNFISLLALFEKDPGTRAIVMIGEIGGTMEEDAAAFIRTNIKKKVFAFIAGRTAPPGKRMGHAGAIIMGGKGGAESKIQKLREAGVTVIEDPAKIGETVKAGLS